MTKLIVKMNFDQLREQLKANNADSGAVDLLSRVLCNGKAFTGRVDEGSDGTAVFVSIEWDAEAVASALKT